MQTIRQFKSDVAVIGCSRLDEEGDLLDFDIQEVGVSRTIPAQSRRTVLVADHSKLKRSAPVRMASLQEIGTFVTDRRRRPSPSARGMGHGSDPGRALSDGISRQSPPAKRIGQNGASSAAGRM